MKIKVNQNLLSIFEFIKTYEGNRIWQDLIQYVLDYELYAEFYLHFKIIQIYVDEKLKGNVINE